MKILAICSIESLCVPPFSVYAPSPGFCGCIDCALAFAACAACDVFLKSTRVAYQRGLKRLYSETYIDMTASCIQTHLDDLLDGQRQFYCKRVFH